MSGPGLQWLDYAAVVGYLAVTAWIAYWATRRTDNTEDYFVGGRSMPWLAVGLSIMATLLSTQTYLAVPGEMIRNGPSYVIGYAAYPVIYLIVSRLWVPFFMRLHLTSAYEYLERRFNYPARLLGNLLFLGMRLGWMSMVVYAASLAMTAMVPGPLTAVTQWVHPDMEAIYLVIGAVGVAATIYACIGGIKAVIWTDVLQAVMLFGGVAVIIGYTIWSEGNGPVAWWNAVKADGVTAPKINWFGDFDITVRMTVFWAFLNTVSWHSCTHCCDQVALQRYFATTSATAARRSFLVSLASSAAIGVLLAISGLALRYFFMRHSDLLREGIMATSGADQLMPFFFADVLPAGFGGLILVSFLCDALQTVGSGVNSIAAIVTRDAQQHGGGAAGSVRAARLITLAVGAVTSVLAVGACYYALHTGSSIIDMMPRMFNMFLGPLAVLFMIGMFYRRATASVAIGSVLLTQLMSTLWSWWGEVPALLTRVGLSGAAEAWISVLGVDAAGMLRTPSIMLAIFTPVVFGLLVGGVASLLFGRRGHAGSEYTWRNVLRRPVEQG
ncbi:MAG: hypothetical protein HY000_36620 [Planctomycetes bacterium]|nr:hypothetical protein [Planctomycetota bacterium]